MKRPWPSRCRKATWATSMGPSGAACSQPQTARRASAAPWKPSRSGSPASRRAAERWLCGLRRYDIGRGTVHPARSSAGPLAHDTPAPPGAAGLRRHTLLRIRSRALLCAFASPSFHRLTLFGSQTIATCAPAPHMFVAGATSTPLPSGRPCPMSSGGPPPSPRTHVCLPLRLASYPPGVLRRSSVPALALPGALLPKWPSPMAFAASPLSARTSGDMPPC